MWVLASAWPRVRFQHRKVRKKRSDARAITMMPETQALHELLAGQDAPGRLALAFMTSVRHQGGAYACPYASSSRGSGLGLVGS